MKRINKERKYQIRASLSALALSGALLASGCGQQSSAPSEAASDQAQPVAAPAAAPALLQELSVTGWGDHIVVGAPDTNAAMHAFAERAGLEPKSVAAEADPALPTISGAYGLGGGAFLEFIGPNPAYAGPAGQDDDDVMAILWNPLG